MSSKLENILRTLHDRKAPGNDSVPSKAFKFNIINAVFNRFNFPTACKQANVILIHKPGTDPTFPVSTIFEKLIQSRLLSHVKDNNILT